MKVRDTYELWNEGEVRYLNGGPAELKNNDKAAVVDHLGILVGVLHRKTTFYSQGRNPKDASAFTWQPTHCRKMNGKVSKTHTFPNRCQAFLRPNFWQRKNASPPSEEMPTNTVEMPSAIWPTKSKTPA